MLLFASPRKEVEIFLLGVLANRLERRVGDGAAVERMQRKKKKRKKEGKKEEERKKKEKGWEKDRGRKSRQADEPLDACAHRAAMQTQRRLHACVRSLFV